MTTEETKAKELFDKAMIFCNELSHDKNIGIAKEISLLIIKEKMESLSTWKNTYMGRQQIKELEKIKEEIKQL